MAEEVQSCECGCGAMPEERCRQVVRIDDEGHVIRDGRRLCACGCGKRLPVNARANRRHLTERHRDRKYRRHRDEALEAAGLPRSLSLKLAETSGSTGNRRADAPTRRRRTTRGPRPGVSAYFQPGDAEALVAALNDLTDSPVLTRAREALAAAIDRRNRRHNTRR